MSENFNWRCPYCDHNAVIRPHYDISQNVHVAVDEPAEKEGFGVVTTFIFCPNESCGKYQFTVRLYENYESGEYEKSRQDYDDRFAPLDIDKLVMSWSLLPDTCAKSYPDYIPKAILDDYREACLIVRLSPKASATLSRRCLQGIIRDFFGVVRSRLSDEIKEIRTMLDDALWKAIDGIRSIGNIGAHMEKDVNLIIDIKDNEAEKLLRSIEILLEETYIRRNTRDRHIAEMTELLDKKQTERKSVKSS